MSDRTKICTGQYAAYLCEYRMEFQTPSRFKAVLVVREAHPGDIAMTMSGAFGSGIIIDRLHRLTNEVFILRAVAGELNDSGIPEKIRRDTEAHNGTDRQS